MMSTISGDIDKSRQEKWCRWRKWSSISFEFDRASPFYIYHDEKLPGHADEGIEEGCTPSTAAAQMDVTMPTGQEDMEIKRRWRRRRVAVLLLRCAFDGRDDRLRSKAEDDFY